MNTLNNNFSSHQSENILRLALDIRICAYILHKLSDNRPVAMLDAEGIDLMSNYILNLSDKLCKELDTCD